MKKIFKCAMMFMATLALSAAFTACGSDDDDTPTANSNQNQQNGQDNSAKTVSESDVNAAAIHALTKQYLEGVVYPTYKNLADKTEELYTLLGEAKDEFKNGNLTDAKMQKISNTFLQARAYWEASEAFLYGPATTFGIDPHIDTWPLDVDALARGLNNASVLGKIEEVGAGELAPTLLGFHAIEFVLFRDGQVRTVEALKGNETDEAFSGMQITGQQELAYAAAVAEDLMQKCFQLQVAWMGEQAGDRVSAVEEWELETKLTDDYYGDNMLNAGKAGSAYRSWQDVLVAIFDAGCSNISNEVANTKIGNAWNAQVYDYIESPYSKKSFVDFYDNILSIKNSLYGGVGLSTPSANSLLGFAATKNASFVQETIAKLDAALAALDVCMKGKAFVDIVAELQAATATKGSYPAVQNAINAINALDDQLKAGAKWAAEIE